MLLQLSANINADAAADAVLLCKCVCITADVASVFYLPSALVCDADVSTHL